MSLKLQNTKTLVSDVSSLLTDSFTWPNQKKEMTSLSEWQSRGIRASVKKEGVTMGQSEGLAKKFGVGAGARKVA